MKIWKLLALATVIMASSNANAALIERLGGLAYYDDVADLTWLADGNASGSTMNWVDANAWAAGLNVASVTGWRLPDTLQPDPSCDGQSGGASFSDNCTGSEMGNLFYNVLGGSAGILITTTHNANYDLFSNVESPGSWSATEVASNSTQAWFTSMNSGGQWGLAKTYEMNAWAVQSGDIGAVPIPAAVWLFGSGLIGLIGVARRKKA